MYNDNYLAHYGVLGMRWGHRKRQPVVVSKQKRPKATKLEKREAKAQKFETKALNAKSDKQKNMYLKEAQRARDGKLSRRQRQVAVGAALVAAYATYKFVDSGEATRLANIGKARLTGEKPYGWAKNDALSHKNLSIDEIQSQVVSRINPGYGEVGTSMNCRRCTFAYEMSRRGYDVKATKSIAGTGQTGFGMYNAVRGNDKKLRGGKYGALMAIKKETHDGLFDFLSGDKPELNQRINLKEEGHKVLSGVKKADSIFSELSKMPDRARGELEIGFEYGRHSVAWEIINKKPVLFDAQTGSAYKSANDFTDMATRVVEASFSRLDNVAITPEIMGRWITNVKPK